MHPDLSLARVLPKVTAGTAVALGLLMLAAGLGLGFALLTSAQPPLQFATAAVLLVTGAVNLASAEDCGRRTEGHSRRASLRLPHWWRT